MTNISGDMEWRKVSKGTWWLVFTDAPEDLGRNGPVGYPPSMVISWGGHSESCVHLWNYFNGAWPDDPDSSEDDVNYNYFHICDTHDLIADLHQWMTTVKYNEIRGEQE